MFTYRAMQSQGAEVLTYTGECCTETTKYEQAAGFREQPVCCEEPWTRLPYRFVQKFYSSLLADGELINSDHTVARINELPVKNCWGAGMK
jgi:hypothetical protein